jgi:carbamoyl-phosphate synthase small subunit
MARWGVPGLAEVDTRALTLILRSRGTCPGAIVPVDWSTERACRWLGECPRPTASFLVGEASGGNEVAESKGRESRAALVDLGVKRGILRELARRGVRARLWPARFDPARLLADRPRFVVLSNGPGDPAELAEVVEAVRGLLGRVPILGICLGHQLLALALGGRTEKLPFGHRGGNRVVREEGSGRLLVVAQNHSYAVTRGVGEAGAEVTYRDVVDGTIEGFRVPALGIEAVQFHPEASPGPHDASSLFDRFLARVERWWEERS